MLALLCCFTIANAQPAAPSAEAFHEYTGARLVFEAEDLPDGRWFDRIIPLDAADREKAASIALTQARHFPRGALAASGLDVVGLFAAVGSTQNDGFHSYDERLNGYAYYGMYNGSDAVIAAHYTDGQLPLTLHHEWYHHLDAVARPNDDQRFAQAISGEGAYPPLRLTTADLQALKQIRRSSAPLLVDAVGAYASKNPNEDQAETARHLHAHLADSLVQVSEHPELPGSQRMLHVLAESEAAGMPTDWLVNVALNRTNAVARHARVRPNGRWQIHGSENAQGVNTTLRADVRRLGAEGAADPRVRAKMQQLALVTDYFDWIAARWSITAGTRSAFQDAKDTILASMPASHRPLTAALHAASLEQLSDLLELDSAGPRHLTDGMLEIIAAKGMQANPYIGKVDKKLDGTFRTAVRRVQPATVRVSTGGGAGSGVNIAPEGLILTAGHVPDAVGRTGTVTFPDGTTARATCVAYDGKLDLALMRLQGDWDLPFARLAHRSPEVGSDVAIVGQPGTTTPDGEATGYQPFHVSVGHIRGVADNPVADQSLGGTAHDAWTYWGHSGSPLFNRRGDIVALHNSWNSRNAMRHAVTWQALDSFLDTSMPATSR